MNRRELIVPIDAIKRAMSGEGPKPSWGEVMNELWPIISAPLSPDGRKLLTDVIDYGGHLRLEDTGEFPHSRSPEEMLKFLARQAIEQGRK